MSAIMFDYEEYVVLDRDEIKKRMLNTGRCTNCFSCRFVEDLRKELNEKGFLSFNENVNLWKIEYEDKKIKAYPVYQL